MWKTFDAMMMFNQDDEFKVGRCVLLVEIDDEIDDDETDDLCFTVLLFYCFPLFRFFQQIRCLSSPRRYHFNVRVQVNPLFLIKIQSVAKRS